MKIDIWTELKDKEPYRANIKTCHGMVRRLLPQIEEELKKGYSKKQIIHAIEKQLGKDMNINTFYSALRRIRKKKKRSSFGSINDSTCITSITPKTKRGAWSPDVDKEIQLAIFKNQPNKGRQL